MEEKVDKGRRKFMEAGVFTITGCIAAVSGITLTGFAVGPSFEKQKLKWIKTDLMEKDLNADSFTQVILEYENKDGWMIAPAKSLAYIHREKNGEITAISASCTHLGCVVNWNEESKIFKCPCHDGRYDAEGRVIGGPPPAPLNRHPVKIEDGQILLANRIAAPGGKKDETV